MAVLNDRGILNAFRDGLVSISPLDPSRIQPASIDLSLGDTYSLHSPGKLDFSSLSKQDLKNLEISKEIPKEGLVISPGEFIVCHTEEHLKFSKQIFGVIYNRSSVVRWGIDAAKANYINPGFEGKMPLVVHNFGTSAITLKKGFVICQLQLNFLEKETLHSYKHRHDPKELAEELVGTGLEKINLDARADDPLSKFLHEKISEITIKE